MLFYVKNIIRVIGKIQLFTYNVTRFIIVFITFSCRKKFMYKVKVKSFLSPTFRGSISQVYMYTSTWKSDMARRKLSGSNWAMYEVKALKSAGSPVSARFSTANGLCPLPAWKVNSGSTGKAAGMSTNRYSTGNGRASWVTSLPY